MTWSGAAALDCCGLPQLSSARLAESVFVAELAVPLRLGEFHHEVPW
jgi:hypothetical protein